MPAQPPPSPPFSLAARSVAAYLKIRRQANLPAWPYPFRLPPSFSLCPPSLPLPAIFRWRREASPRIQKIRRQANLSAWPCPFRLPPSFSLCPPSLPLPAPFVGGAKRRRVSKRFAVRRISPLWLGRIVKEGAGPLLDTPAPLPRPAFPATPTRPRGRVSGGGLPSRLPIVPGGFAGGHGAISALLPEPPVPPCSHPTPQPFLQPWHGGNRFL